jgi:hypothetical protein
MIFIICFYCNQIKEDEMGVACSKHYMENEHRVYLGNLKERTHFRNLCTDCRIILQCIVAYLLKARIVKPAEKEPLLGNGCVTRNNAVTARRGVSVRSVPRLFNEDELPLLESPETAVRRVWCEVAASLRGYEPGSRGICAIERSYQSE